MKKLPARLTSTHIDRHNERMALSALESLVTHINTAYLPVGIEHDPRIPPVGRIASAEIKELEDGEYAVDAILEIFESGDIIELTDSKRLLPIHENIVGELHISYDRNFRNAEDQILIKEIGELFDARPQEEMKKALDPITVLTIGGAFLLGGIAKGFLGKLGTDSYEILKDRLKKLMGRKKEGEKEKLLKFQACVQKDGYAIEVDVILTNPSAEQIDRFLNAEIVELDNFSSTSYIANPGLRKIVFEYSDKGIELKFGIRSDAVPVFYQTVKIVGTTTIKRNLEGA